MTGVSECSQQRGNLKDNRDIFYECYCCYILTTSKNHVNWDIIAKNSCADSNMTKLIYSNSITIFRKDIWISIFVR
ncbi:hypothetical protein [Photorhabdus laumondii]|uniref:hypothetical protein n=1 Tax=Photorhabdus laumondii TaxID=2218628 RepID=UPI0033160EE1